MAFFDCDGVRLYLGVPESPDFRSNPLLYLLVQDLEEAYSALRERGVQFRDSPHLVHRAGSSELWMTFFTDPDGNNLALMADKPVQSAG